MLTHGIHGQGKLAYRPKAVHIGLNRNYCLCRGGERVHRQDAQGGRRVYYSVVVFIL